MKIRDIQRVQPLLLWKIHQAIIDSVITIAAAANARGKTAQEPDFVASLCPRFSPDLYNILEGLFPSNRFAVTSIFCHQKPIVDIGEKKDTELGDLLLMYAHTDNKGKKQYNSILLQAKVTSKQVSKVSASDAHQLKLYEKWPDFKYLRARKLTGTKRSIVPKAATNGGQYLLIDDDPVNGLSGAAGTFPMGCAWANPVLTLNNNLAIELVEFLKFKSGRTFEGDPLKSTDEWTKMIWDLIEITKGVKSKRIHSGLDVFDRQKINQPPGYVFFNSSISSILEDLHYSLSNTNKYKDSMIDNDSDNRGISLILIESNDSEIQEREDEG